MHFVGQEPRAEDCMIEISRPNSLGAARHNEMSFVSRLSNFDEKTQAGLIVCAEDTPNLPQSRLLRVENPRLWFIRICETFFPPGPPMITLKPGYKYVDPLARIGGEGFGFEWGENGLLEKFPHYAGVTIGKDVEIKAFAAIDRGVFEDTVIGDGTKIDNLVHVAHNAKVGKNCLLVAGTVLGGGVEVGDNSYLMIGSLVKPHVKIGRNAKIGMGAVVLHDVKDYECVIGNPARVHELRPAIPA